MSPLALLAAFAKRAFGLIPWWVWPLALCASMGAGLTAYQWASADEAKARAALSEIRAQVAEATAKAEAAAREKESTLLAANVALSDQLTKEKRRAQETQARLVADIRAGTQRLSIAARCPAPASQAGADSAPAAIGGAEGARAELDPEAAEALVAIAADGDEAIRERNACIAAYNDIRDTLNAR